MKGRIKKRKKSIYGYLFIALWLIGFALLVLWPMIQSGYFGLNNVRITPAGRVYQFVGFKNFRDVWLKDLFFVQELGGFLIGTALQLPIIIVFSLIIAILLNQNFKGKGLYRTIFFLPVIISSGPVMNQLIDQGATTIPLVDTAMLSSMFNSFLPTWLAQPFADVFTQMIVILWYSGVQILIFIAGLQKIDKSLYEAAKIDGGSEWECFWKITLPILKPLILLNSVYTLVTLSNSGQNNIINLIYSNMFNATRGYGFASAMAWMYAFIILLLIGIVLFLFRDTSMSQSKIRKKRGRVNAGRNRKKAKKKVVTRTS